MREAAGVITSYSIHYTKLYEELVAAWLKLQAARSEVAALQAEILPVVEKSFEAVVYGYQAGKFDLLEVLDAERTSYNFV